MWGIIKKVVIIIFILLALFIGGRTIYKLYKEPTKESEKNWENIHPDFKNNSQLIQEWEQKGFDYNQTKAWILVGLEPKLSQFAYFLVKAKRVNATWFLDNYHQNQERILQEYIQWKAINEHIKDIEEKQIKELENFQNQLTNILTQISQSETDLWEAYEYYESSNDILLQVAQMDEKTFDRDKITKPMGEIKGEFLLKLVDFCQKLEQGEVRLEDLHDSYLIQLDKCIKIGKQTNENFKNYGFYDEEQFQRNETVLINCREKNKNEVEKRSKNN